ncbi:MAG TPA: hypothetical protein VD866_27800 [Urbifossiella sp.]|nr:hypothetical protein [Urbifossiella sp.]
MPTVALLVALSAATPPPLPVAPPPRHAVAADISVAWRNRVSSLPDPTRDGLPQPGLLGRLFLYSATGGNATADGRLVVELADGRGAVRETWTFTSDVLGKLAVGGPDAGYFLFLPLTSNPRGQGRLTTRYEPADGRPVRAAVTVIEFGAGVR